MTIDEKIDRAIDMSIKLKKPHIMKIGDIWGFSFGDQEFDFDLIDGWCEEQNNKLKGLDNE